MERGQTRSQWRESLYHIIFEAETPAGRAFDVALLWFIVISVLAVSLETVASIANVYGEFIVAIEWACTIIFTIEYVLRLISARNAWRYAGSFYGIVDLLSVIPTYVSLLVPGSQYFIVIRSVRLLRVFRVLKLMRYVGEANTLLRALRASKAKITVFLYSVLTLVVIIGTLMYLIEGEDNGFSSIPKSIYWAIVTLTTVGYGDIAPQTTLGQALASVVMIIGYGIIAVPTGIVTAELSRHAGPVKQAAPVELNYCPNCGSPLGMGAG